MPVSHDPLSFAGHTDDLIVPAQPIEAGAPKASILSPILSVLYILQANE